MLIPNLSILNSIVQHENSVIAPAASESWYDYKLHWEPKEYGGVHMLHVPSDHIWRPDIVLYNKHPFLKVVSYESEPRVVGLTTPVASIQIKGMFVFKASVLAPTGSSKTNSSAGKGDVLTQYPGDTDDKVQVDTMLRDRITSLQSLLKTLRAQLFQEKEKLRFEIEETIHLASNNGHGAPSRHILRHPLDDYSETTLRNYEHRLLHYRDNMSYFLEDSSLVRIPGPHPTTYKRNIANVEKLCEVELSRMKKNISQMNTAVRRASMSPDEISSPHNPMYEFYSGIYGGVLKSSHDTGTLSSDMFNYNPRRSDRINCNARISSYPTLNIHPNVKVDCRMSTNNVCTLPSDVSGRPPGDSSSTGYITQKKYITGHDYNPEGFQGGCRGADLTFKNLANQRMHDGRPFEDDDKREYDDEEEEEQEECEMEYSDDEDIEEDD
uniref:Neurotransmitter-gated ion-channel ligand-binding domain-containing protein n=1 Tax=Timema bartmani TaxID=61472 RepID=A0A7R9I8Q3_9NEOP|nr:unnamed protein product [Timema bartmani]